MGPAWCRAALVATPCPTQGPSRASVAWLGGASPRELRCSAVPAQLPSHSLLPQIGKGAAHTEAAWAERLPGALAFLLQPWWASVAAGHAHDLFFTSPRKLQASAPACAHYGHLSGAGGRKQGQSLCVSLGWVQLMHGLQQKLCQPSQAGACAALPQAGQPATLFVNRSKSHVLAGHTGQLLANVGFNGWAITGLQLQLQPAPQLEGEIEGVEGAAGTKWQAVSFTVPPDAYEMQFVLTDGQGNWDNNAGKFGGRVGGVGERIGGAQVCDSAPPASHLPSACLDAGGRLFECLVVR